jgi:putative addiction module CopG family antidote
MNVSLTEELEKYVRRKVASGLYNNASEVIRQALRLHVENERAPHTRRARKSSKRTLTAQVERSRATVQARARRYDWIDVPSRQRA